MFTNIVNFAASLERFYQKRRCFAVVYCTISITRQNDFKIWIYFSLDLSDFLKIFETVNKYLTT